MKKLSMFLLLVSVMIVSGCTTVKGESVSERRAYVNSMASKAIDDLYKTHPEAKGQMAKAAGYTVLSNINTNLIFVTTSAGYGVAVNKGSGGRTYLKMGGGGVGFGAGVRDLRLILIFKKSHDLQSFIDNGWDARGQLGASAKSGDQGGELNAAQSADLDIITYQLTQSGVALEATIGATKIWKDDELN